MPNTAHTAATRKLLAEYLMLDEFNDYRHSLGHDYGNGQRNDELMRRRNELTSYEHGVTHGELREVVLDEFTADELTEAFRTIAVPRIERLERENYRRTTTATTRTLKAWAGLHKIAAAACGVESLMPAPAPQNPGDVDNAPALDADGTSYEVLHPEHGKGTFGRYYLTPDGKPSSCGVFEPDNGDPAFELIATESSVTRWTNDRYEAEHALDDGGSTAAEGILDDERAELMAEADAAAYDEAEARIERELAVTLDTARKRNTVSLALGRYRDYLDELQAERRRKYDRGELDAERFDKLFADGRESQHATDELMRELSRASHELNAWQHAHRD